MEAKTREKGTAVISLPDWLCLVGHCKQSITSAITSSKWQVY